MQTIDKSTTIHDLVCSLSERLSELAIGISVICDNADSAYNAGKFDEAAEHDELARTLDEDYWRVEKQLRVVCEAAGWRVQELADAGNA